MDKYITRVKAMLKGNREKEGLTSLLIGYFVLIGIGFIYLYPILYMLLHSVMSAADMADPSVMWVPKTLSFENYSSAYKTLSFGESFKNSLIMSVVPAVFQTAAASFVGFGIARFSFPLKKLWLVLVAATFLLPGQLFIVPRYAMYFQMGILDTVFPSFLPALLGQGIRSAVFILVFFVFFSSYPIAYDEAAKIDGANNFRLYYKIALPMAKPAITLSFLFSLVWYWNETSESSMYFGGKITTLPMQLAQFAARYADMFGRQDSVDTVAKMYEAIPLAGTCLSILPLVVIYLLLQKQFVESIERAGITGE